MVYAHEQSLKDIHDAVAGKLYPAHRQSALNDILGGGFGRPYNVSAVFVVL